MQSPVVLGRVFPDNDPAGSLAVRDRGRARELTGAELPVLELTDSSVREAVGSLAVSDPESRHLSGLENR